MGRMKRRRVGPAVVVALPLVNLALWAAVPPADDGSRAAFVRQVIGEAIGSTAVVLLATALVLSTRARLLEPYFGGLDKMYRAHRRVGQAATLVLILHVVTTPWRLTPGGGVPAGLIAFVGLLVLVGLTASPRLPALGRVVRIGYRGWRRTHRLIGIFFLMVPAHMLLVDSLVRTSPPLFATVAAALGVGIAAYLYGLLLARFVRPTYRYVVTDMRRLSEHTVEVTLRPRKRKRLAFRSGQFVFVTFRRWRLREPHPFTVSSSPTEDTLRLTIKAAGDFTRLLHQRLESGCKATVEGSYGMLDYRRGGTPQLWIAGGIGVTPFLSWLRDLPADPARTIDFFYTVRAPEDALFWDEIKAAERLHGRLRVHLIVSGRDGPLTLPRVASIIDGRLRDREVYLCGPVPMIRTFQRDLRRAGVPASSLHFEEFSFR
jgi:predicted ferric reductase